MLSILPPVLSSIGLYPVSLTLAEPVISVNKMTVDFIVLYSLHTTWACKNLSQLSHWCLLDLL